MLPSNFLSSPDYVVLNEKCGVILTMPKIKTVRGAAKRFKKTASGGFKRKQSHLRHILTKKQLNVNVIYVINQWLRKQTKF
ncbi:hypothetical protein CGSHi3655_03166 [Haemophilus influenzae 3655]|uniref:50S ribosomal protein L35 n=1 Tax=Haemophilus influenzae (strain NTHi 3655) TaxID=375177 RepID=A0A0H3PD10_HAEI3|nr:hypothetical protein CGSHi3655_03166 [Haemophilus influenzae 3655]